MESKVFLDQHMESGRLINLPLVEVGIFSARPVSAGEGHNEDASAIFRIDEKRLVLALADGVGGGPGGERASAMAVEEVERAIASGLGEEKEVRYCIMDGFEHANGRILEAGIGSATTLAVVEVDGFTIRPYHAGDSRIFLFGQRGRLRLATVAHSPMGYALESGVMDESEAMNHSESNVITNYVGSAHMHIEVGPAIELARRDTLLISSDGLTDNLTTEEIVAIARKHPLDRVLENLSKTTLGRMEEAATAAAKPDDLTFILLRRAR